MKYLAPLLLLLLLGLPASLFGQEKVQVFAFSIDSEIDPRSSRLTDLALEAAQKQKADLIVLRLNTFGGMLKSAEKIRNTLLESPTPVWVFIDKNAASAGALIALAGDSIYMNEGASMGAASVVNQQGELMPDKYQSYMRSLMRSTAETQGRNPRIAEDMVMPQGDSGQPLTLTTSEAQARGYCEGQASALQGVLAQAGLENYQIRHYQQPLSETVIGFFLNPFISGVLIMLIIGGLYFELQSPGLGAPSAVAVLAALLYLVPYYLNGLAAHWEIAVVVVGLGLIALEVFVIPGFGISGILGIAATLTGLALMMLNNDYFDFGLVPISSISSALTALLIGVLGGLAILVFGGASLAQSPVMERVALKHTLAKEENSQENGPGISGVQGLSLPEKGQNGQALTVLRPGGKVRIGEEVYDAFTRGEFLQKGEAVEVIGYDISTLKVRRKET